MTPDPGELPERGSKRNPDHGLGPGSRALRAGLTLAGGNVGMTLLRLLRNVLIARMVSVEDFGVAATFAITLSILEMMSGLSVGHLVVQAKDGDNPKLLAAIQGLMLARGALIGAILFALSWPLAAMFGHPDLVWAYQLIALAPLLRGAGHIDVVRMQRNLRFAPIIVSRLVSTTLTLLAVWPLAIWLEDYRVMLALLMFDAFARMLITHLVAERPFRAVWDAAVLRRALKFGWPLLINGALVFAIMQGDRIIVSNQFGALDLGLFSAALSLTMTPALLASRIFRAFFLPVLSGRQDDAAAFRRVLNASLQTSLIACMGLICAVVILGPAGLVLIYGEKFAPGLALLPWLGILAALRIVKAGSGIAAIATAHTRIPMIANLVRLVSLPLAFLAALQGAGIVTVIQISILGELVSLAISMALLPRMLGSRARLDRMTAPFVVAAALGVAVTLSIWNAPPELGEAGLRGLAAPRWEYGGFLALLGLLVAVSPEMRSRWMRALGRGGGKRARG